VAVSISLVSYPQFEQVIISLVIALSLFLFTGGADIALSLLLVILLAALAALNLVEPVIAPGVAVVMAHALSLSSKRPSLSPLAYP